MGLVEHPPISISQCLYYPCSSEKKTEYVNNMMRRFLGAELFGVVALAAASFAACGGAPEPQQPASPISAGAIVPGMDAGPPVPAPALAAEAPQAAVQDGAPPPVAEPAGAADAVPPPIAAIDQPPTPAPASPAVPESPCEELRALKNAAPLFAHPPLPCDRVDRVTYYRRAADGTCGPSSALTVTADGGVALGTAIAGDAPAAAEGACPRAKTARSAIDPGDARRLVSSACAAVNGSYSLAKGIGCQSAAVRLYFFEGEIKLGETAALPCPPHTLDGVVAELEAIAAGLR
jgi:hypothetical protein